MIPAHILLKEIIKGNRGQDKFVSVVPPPKKKNVKGASIDLHLGRWFVVPHQSRQTHFSFDPLPGDRNPATKEYFVDFNSPFVLHPGRFALAATLEWIRLPANRAGMVTGKSSIGRRGLVIETAPGVHPFFNGCLTLEIANLGEVPLVVSPGMEICQLFLHEIVAVPADDRSTFSCQIKPILGKA